MKSLKVLFILTLVFSLKLQAQVDTTKSNNLLDEEQLESIFNNKI
jgi:hypothetical protein